MPTRCMNKGGIEAGGFDGICRDQRLLVGENVVFKDFKGEEEMGSVKNLTKHVYSSDESSSIGENSDVSEISLEKSGDGEEVQSSCRGPLDCMVALEEVLPIRKGISDFYNGKSKSFASLADASSLSSIKELAKPEKRKRRNLLAYNLTWGKTRLQSCAFRISKRVTTSSRTTNTRALAVAMTSSSSSDNIEKQLHSTNGSLYVARKDFSSW